MKKLIVPFFSMLTTGVLLIVFAISIGYATFVENDYGTMAAKVLIYNAWWFELLLLLLAINLCGSIVVNNLITRKKWAILLFHVSFLIIVAGAAITRYTSFEGSLHIREGARNNQLLTESAYVNITATNGTEKQVISKEVKFTGYTANRLKQSFTIGGRDFTVENLQFVPSATETVVDDPSGAPIAAFMAVDPNMKRTDFLLTPGETKNVDGLQFNFTDVNDSVAINITTDSGMVYFLCSDSVALVGMSANEIKMLAPGEKHQFLEKNIYQLGDLSFVLKKFFTAGKPQLIYVPSHTGSMTSDGFHAQIKSGDFSRDLFVFGKPGAEGKPVSATIDGTEITVSYGSVIHELPFSLHLNDFQIERYPGSNSPSSFASEVTLIDSLHKVEKPYRIFMNNILKYRGYRFFQSSFDEDEKGTVLSVNYDSAGTAVTYIGYLLLTIGMIMTLFSRNSRFKRQARKLNRLHDDRKKLFAPLLVLGLLLVSPGIIAQNQQKLVDTSHASEFGKLQVQNTDGRIEPVNTLASEILRKVAKKGSFDGMDPVQVLMAIIMEPEKWQNVPMIKVASVDLQKIIGVNTNYASFSNMLSETEEGGYKLRKYVEEAYNKKPAQRNKFDKEVINVDERVNILYKQLNNGFLTIFPVPGHENNKWLAPAGAPSMGESEVSKFAFTAFGEYVTALKAARESGNYDVAHQLLEKILDNQKVNGAAIYPPVAKTSLEIFYVNFNIFKKLALAYIVLGMFLLILQLISIFNPRTKSSKFIKPGFWLVTLLFVLHTAGLGIRWYISGHAPWSNGYETLIYISWATCLAGLIFARRSEMTLAVTTVLSAITLFVAGMSWMSPELTNLVPVLKSYWLIIHVAIITASYGFLAMGALLGLVNLLLMILRNNLNVERINLTIKELVLIIEMAIIAGLFMLTIGAFLGGVWANESWGRYWGWDPKETWALVTVLVYAFITHMHKIPGFRGSFAVSCAALVGFSSVLMTFFGVNYYLSGLHSYAQGEPAPIPMGVFVAVFIVVMVIVTAFLSEKYWLKAGNTAEDDEND